MDPDLALSIAQAESSLRPGAKNPRSSARGLFQVTNDTWKQYGGDPKRRNDINEDIRVGLDIIADNTQALSQTLGRAPRPGEVYAAHFFGKAGARRILSADPNAPIADVVSKAVMKANPELLQGKTVGEAINTLGRKVGDETQTQGTTVSAGGAGARGRVPAGARPVDGGYREDPAKPPVISRAVQDTEALGPGYQAALALSYLADTEESSDDERDPSIVEREAAAEVAQQAAPQRSSAAQMLAGMDFGFAPVVGQQQQQEPVRMATGGAVGQSFTPEEITQIRRGLTAQGFKEPVPATPSFSGSSIMGRALGRALFNRLRQQGPSPTQLTQAELQAVYGTTGVAPQMTQPSGDTGTSGASRSPLFRLGRLVNRLSTGDETRSTSPRFVASQELIEAKRAQLRGTPTALGFGERLPNDSYDAFKARFPTLATFTPGTATVAPGPTQVAPPALSLAAQAPNTAASMLQNVLVPTPSIMDMQAPVKMAQGGFADGGEVTDPYAQMMQGAPRERVSPGQFLRGGLDTAAGMLKGATQAAVGLPGDIESLVRMGVGSKRDTVLPTTDDVKRVIDRVAPLNLPADPGTGGRTAAEYFGEFMSPAAATRPLVRGAQAVGEGVIEGARRTERALDKPVQDIMQRGGRAAEMLQSFSTVPSFAVRPPGGNVFPEFVNDVVASRAVDRALQTVPENRQDDIREFINTKAKRYFEKDYASTKDPLYEAFKEGRVGTLADTPAFRNYMLNAARDGNPEALEDLARSYDRGLEPVVVTRRAEGEDYTAQLQRERDTLARLQRSLMEAPGPALEVERQLPSRYSLFRSQENIEGYPLNRPLTEGELKAVERGDPLYKHTGAYGVPDFMRPEAIVEALADIPPERLKSMSYPEAVIAVNQPARLTANWNAAISRVREGKDVPKEVKAFGLSQPLLKSDNGAWHRIQDARAAEMEGAMMGHSVGGYSRVGSYGHGGLEALQSGRAKVFTLRDNKGNARVTVEALDTPEGMEITQIKGRSNAGPREAEVQDVMKLFEQLDEGGRLRGIRTESYLTKENAPADALQGTTEWQRLYDEYLLGKQ